MAGQTFVTNTFSPMMLGEGTAARVQEITIKVAREMVKDTPEGLRVSAVSHELTAPVISALLGVECQANRINVSLDSSDTLIAIIPGFRASVAREFTREEVEEAGARCFLVVGEAAE